jgi:hypothetical protein
LRRKKTGFEIVEICGGFGQIPSFLLLKGRANPNPLTPKEDDRIDIHLKYYIYRHTPINNIGLCKRNKVYKCIG